MNRDQLLTELRGCLSEIRAHGPERSISLALQLVDLARDDSDIDIFIEAEQSDRFNAFDLIDIKTILETRLEARVDLTTRRWPPSAIERAN